MDVDSESTATSIDENTENFCDNPTRDTLAEGLMGLIKPTVDQLDERVRATRISQLELKQCIEALCEELKKIGESQQTGVDLDNYVKKLINAKQRVTVLSNILQNVQDRLNKVHASIEKETPVMLLTTPDYDLSDYPQVYEPGEDTFLFLDALEMEVDFLRSIKPKFAVEIGSGSGVVIAALEAILENSCAYFATDINPEACAATANTSLLNGACVDCVNMDLLGGFKRNLFDLILFNPPYVVTESEEIAGFGLNRAWAGGVNGREITDRLLFNLDNLLASGGVCYMVLLKQNNIQEVRSIMHKNKFNTELVVDRRHRGEHLYVVKFTRFF
ncbi:Snapin Pallidin, Methyltransf 26, and/or MTS domain containing protein [Asbolus verrucosus]|uniref:Methyltransferase HEMK2 n=1 Tax=Asbolus verrucosus TaxID=1661398 RepID=A0A482VIH3_ASBVE|nr:Snapin Pallidin, Methyltransf 26, and/or MTS domain containing protein [Asbolus verrucosus]